MSSVGFNTIEFYSDLTFIKNGAAGLASSIVDKGNYEIEGDTIFLTLTTPRIINHVQTVTNPSHYAFRSDTLYRVDSLSFNSKRYYTTYDYKIIEER